MTVMVVEAAFAQRDRAVADERAQRGHVAISIECMRVVRMDPRRVAHEPRMRRGDGTRTTGRLDRLADTHESARTGEARALDHCVAVIVESRVPEMDVDALISRAPAVAIVDELAHVNAPGSRNGERWQDIDELLDAGIDVISTVNVQHLESLNDVVAQITGVPQRETVPDEVVRRADQVELADITPEALRRRMLHGNVYPAEKVDAALANYFGAALGRGRALCAAALSLWSVGASIDLARLVIKARQVGYAFETDAWQRSQLAGWLRANAARLDLYTNNPAALWLLVQHKSRMLSGKSDDATLRELGARLAQRPSAVVQFPNSLEPCVDGRALADRWHYPAPLRFDRGLVWLPPQTRHEQPASSD